MQKQTKILSSNRSVFIDSPFFFVIKMLARKVYTTFPRVLFKYISSVSLKEPEKFSEESSEVNIIRRKQNVLEHPDFFKVHNLFTVKDLFDAKVHYGHKITSLNKKMTPFIFGSRLDHIVFDLDITAHHLREALNFAAHIAYRNGVILFISKNPRMTLLVDQTALECKEFACTREWRLGTFTNSEKIYKNVIRLPDLCIFLNVLEENASLHQAVLEAAKMCIPTIGIVDSNCDPNLITYPVPGNDDSLSCFKLFCNLFKQAILRGKEAREKHLLELEMLENKDDPNVKEDSH